MKKNLIKRKKHTAMAFVLIMTVICSGCENSSGSKIPKLKEPVSASAVYRPAEYGSIDIKALLGTVEPKDYCHYYDINAAISEIVVNIGDTVEAGDILAYADVDEAKASLTEYQQQLSYENASYQLNQSLSNMTLEKLEYQRTKQKELTETIPQASPEDVPQINQENIPQTEPQDVPQTNVEDAPQTNPQDASQTNPESVSQINTTDNTETSNQPEAAGPIQNGGMPIDIDYDTQISVEQENARYDVLLHEYRVKKLEKSIESLQKIVDNGTLTAKHSGQVTYIKNLVNGRQAAPNENLVIVSDLADTSIELTNMNVQKYEFSEYEEKYITIAGEKIPVEEKEYSTEEMILSKVNQHFPNVHFQCPEGYTFNIGDTYMVYFTKKDTSNTLVIGNDSLYTEGNQYYVYVKNDSGEQEKRFIEIGKRGNEYTQVTSGLSEGELVYYQSASAAPSEYTEYTVALSDFEISNYGSKFVNANASVFSCKSDYEGEIVELAITNDQEVTKGDLLYVIDTGEGKAALAAAQNAIDQENASYQKKIASINEQIDTTTALPAMDDSINYELQILNIQKELAGLEHENILSELQKDYKQISNGNDGTGKVSVYAPVSGTVSALNIAQGDKIKSGDDTLMISTPSNLLLVQMKPDAKLGESTTMIADNIADVGETVTIQKGNSMYEGTCVGWAASSNNQEKGYVYTDEQGEAHLSYYGSSDYAHPSFYIKMNDASFSADENKGEGVKFTYVSMHSVVAIPSSLVYSEADPTVQDKMNYYVWRVVNEELVKQYVLVDESLKSANSQLILSGISPGDILAQE